MFENINILEHQMKYILGVIKRNVVNLDFCRARLP